MLEIDDCEFVAAMVAAGIPTPVAEGVASATKKWAEQEETDDELRHHQDRG